MPPSRQVTPPACNSTAISLRTVSVVMRASAAALLPSALNPSANAGIPSAMGSSLSGWPMTPVEATTTSDAGMDSCLATSSLMASATSWPLALQVFALPLLQITARALPSARCA